MGWDHQTALSKHESQTDAAKGFGGKYGVQKESQDEVIEIESYTNYSLAHSQAKLLIPRPHSHASFPGLIPRPHSQASFPGLIPRSHPQVSFPGLIPISYNYM